MKRLPIFLAAFTLTSCEKPSSSSAVEPTEGAAKSLGYRVYLAEVMLEREKSPGEALLAQEKLRDLKAERDQLLPSLAKAKHWDLSQAQSVYDQGRQEAIDEREKQRKLREKQEAEFELKALGTTYIKQSREIETATSDMLASIYRDSRERTLRNKEHAIRMAEIGKTMTRQECEAVFQKGAEDEFNASR